MNKPNRVTLFSNGMGHFVRHYGVKPGDPERISLPFNRNHISDVATSLNTFCAEGGQVRYSVPPSFTPTNANASTLQIDARNAMKSLLQRLSGAEAKLSFVNSGKGPEEVVLLGIDEITSVGVNGETVTQDCVSVLRNGGWHTRYRLSELTGVQFTNETVQAEVEKALRQNFQQIKPESTFVDLVLEADEEALAAVTYTVPVAAWKMRYSINQEGDKFYLEGAVVVDNNTDEDWDNFVVSVVTGDPISFMTDIATITTPQRRTVNLVNAHAMGNVDVEEGYMDECVMEAMPAAAGGFEAARGGARAMKMSATRSVANVASFGMEEADFDGFSPQQMVASDGVEAKEVGDFCVFTAKTPITIGSKKSAVVPMFNVELTKAGVVLLYKEQNHSRRPFRAVKFKNETDHTLGKGKVVIYNDGLLAGECVLETAKPNDNRMLPHCLENGVKIVREGQHNESVVSSLQIAEGSAVQEWLNTADLTYLVQNKRDEEFNIALEVPSLLGDMEAEFRTEGVEVSEVEKLNNGRRLYFKLAPNASLKVTVFEKSIRSQTVNIGGNFRWIRNNVTDLGDLANHEGILRCAALEEQIQETTNEQQELNLRINKLDQQADRIRRNIESAGDERVSEWVQDLDRMDKEARDIEDTKLPALQEKVQQLQKDLNQALRDLTLTWGTPQVVQADVVE